MRKPGHQVDPDHFREAVDAVRAGASARAVAKALGYSDATIRRWVDMAGRELGPDGRPVAPAAPGGVTAERLARVVGGAAPSAPPPPPAAPPPPAEDHLGRLRWLTDKAINMAQAAQDDPAGPNYSNVKGLLKMVADLAPVLARLERQQSENADVVIIPRADFDAARARIDDRLGKLLARPVYCARCQARVKHEREVVAGKTDNPDAR